jgi:hypothetical protein
MIRTRRLLTDTINSSVEELVTMFLPVVGQARVVGLGWCSVLGGVWKQSVITCT